MIRAFADADQFMGAVLIVKDGKILLDKGYGFADLPKKKPNVPNTQFYIGSVTKQFTAASVLLLEERGKLSIGDPVGKFLPGLPTIWAGIPLKNLLTHTSGIPDYFSGAPKTAMASPMTSEQKLALVRDKPLKFVTDTAFDYSNTNYLLLTMVVEKLEGIPFAQFLAANIFKPLHMDSTQCNVELQDTKGYVSRPGGLDVERPTAYSHTSESGEGCISSTTHDLLRWQQALFGGQVLSEASLTKMTTAYKNNRGVDSNRGFGLVIRAPRGGYRWIHHSGAVPGFNSDVAWYRDLNMSVIILENVEIRQPAPSVDTMRTYIVDILSGKNVPAPIVHKEAPVKAETLAVYPGTYSVSPDTSFVVSLENGQLYVQWTEETKWPIYPEAENRFFLKAVEAQIEFIKSQEGEVTSLKFHQPNHVMVAVRR